MILRAFASTTPNLTKIKMFHTDRESEFKNKLIVEALQTFDIERSLSLKGSLYDNAVAEAMIKVLKIVFVKGAAFENQAALDLELFD